MRRDGRAAGLFQAFQQAHPQARPRQVGRRDEAVVPASYDGDVYRVGACRVVAQLR
ncbi:hypothetical protein MMARJ_44780 [Mycobacterium marseillense]|uniref:Uncharacterized protein n=1 Tax=Mycobacterium marseillense TaxID=701042 RepID=A0ABM7JJD5_9MYCO|nr:hypothetical protein MMARJ_44780 [Mycobacterium marseillense]